MLAWPLRLESVYTLGLDNYLIEPDVGVTDPTMREAGAKVADCLMEKLGVRSPSLVCLNIQP
ncbi:hypothetical protein [[Phormidium ambiguum] IAM M-71]|uniref:hypothetical protein n=1 Tax=[Phormidium ambiguum] IAM M-71 TaxID=454136 RepID=UPI0011614E8C|nr:hypothetical protein [Phormidium ambiguum]